MAYGTSFRKERSGVGLRHFIAGVRFFLRECDFLGIRPSPAHFLQCGGSAKVCPRLAKYSQCGYSQCGRRILSQVGSAALAPTFFGHAAIIYTVMFRHLAPVLGVSTRPLPGLFRSAKKLMWELKKCPGNVEKRRGGVQARPAMKKVLARVQLRPGRTCSLGDLQI